MLFTLRSSRYAICLTCPQPLRLEDLVHDCATSWVSIYLQLVCLCVLPSRPLIDHRSAKPIGTMEVVLPRSGL